MVFDHLEDEGLLKEETTLVIHAGTDNYDEFLQLLEGTPVEVELPIQALGLGERLFWYDPHHPADHEQ